MCLIAGVCMLLYCTLVVFVCLFVCLFVLLCGLIACWRSYCMRARIICKCSYLCSTGMRVRMRGGDYWETCERKNCAIRRYTGPPSKCDYESFGTIHSGNTGFYGTLESLDLGLL